MTHPFDVPTSDVAKRLAVKSCGKNIVICGDSETCRFICPLNNNKLENKKEPECDDGSCHL